MRDSLLQKTCSVALLGLLMSGLVACDKPNTDATESGSSVNAVAPEKEKEQEDPEAKVPTCKKVSARGEAPRYAATHQSEEKYVVLGGAISEIVASLGHANAVVATDTSSTYPEAIKNKPKVGYFRKVNAEGLLATSPTMLLATSEAGPEDVMTRIEATGLEVKTFEGGESVDDALERVERVGDVLGEEACAAALISEMKLTLEQVEKTRETLSKNAPSVLFIYARGANLVMVSGKDTPAAQMLELAGLRNAVDSFEGFKPLSPEVVLEAQPDLILIPAKGAKSLGGDDAVMGLKGVSDTDAARQGRLITIDDLALLGFGPRFPHALKELQEKSQALMLEKEKGSRSP